MWIKQCKSQVLTSVCLSSLLYVPHSLVYTFEVFEDIIKQMENKPSMSYIKLNDMQLMSIKVTSAQSLKQEAPFMSKNPQGKIWTVFTHSSRWVGSKSHFITSLFSSEKIYWPINCTKTLQTGCGKTNW